MKSKFFYALGILLLLLALLPLMRSRPASLPWFSDPAQAFGHARENGTEVLAFLYTDWCSYCRQMDQTTFRDPDVISEVTDAFTSLRLNAEKDPAGIKMQQRFSITAYPTILILDSDGREIQRLQGYIDPEQFVARVGVRNGSRTMGRNRAISREGDPSSLSW
jgi:thioredoxin-related protein